MSGFLGITYWVVRIFAGAYQKSVNDAKAKRNKELSIAVGRDYYWDGAIRRDVNSDLQILDTERNGEALRIDINGKVLRNFTKEKEEERKRIEEEYNLKLKQEAIEEGKRYYGIRTEGILNPILHDVETDLPYTLLKTRFTNGEYGYYMYDVIRLDDPKSLLPKGWPKRLKETEREISEEEFYQRGGEFIDSFF